MPDNVRILPEAERDITDAFEWYEEHRRGLGDDFLRQVRGCLDYISLHPESYDPVYGAFAEHCCADSLTWSFSSSPVALLPCSRCSTRLEIRRFGNRG